MSALAKILTSLHGRRVGLSQRGDLVINGRTVPSADDTGAIREVQGDPATLNATGTLTIAQMLSKIVTSTTAAAVTATLPTGALIDAEGSFNVNEGFSWRVVNTGGTNAFAIQAATNHTIVGSAAVAASTSAEFFTRKTATGTYVTYRI